MSGGSQRLHDPCLAVRLGRQKMRCDAVRGTVVGGQQAGRLAVQRGETRGRELSDEGLAHDRMYEGQLASSREHVGGTQRVGGHLSAVTVQGSEGRCVSQSAAGAEHRRGLRQSLTVSTQLCEPDQHTATNRACAELADPAGELSTVGRVDSSFNAVANSLRSKGFPPVAW